MILILKNILPNMLKDKINKVDKKITTNCGFIKLTVETL